MLTVCVLLREIVTTPSSGPDTVDAKDTEVEEP